jgi:hypothetical protein
MTEMARSMRENEYAKFIDESFFLGSLGRMAQKAGVLG